MPKYNYTAKEGPGKQCHGVVEATNLDVAIAKVIQLGLTPMDVVELEKDRDTVVYKKTKKQFKLFKKIRLQDKAVFTRQVSDMVESSVPMLKALKLVGRQTQNNMFRETIKEICVSIEDGGSFSGALAKHPTVFSSLYVEMVASGELSGQLPVILNRLALHMEKEKEINDKVRASLAYPMVILCVGFLTIFVLLSFVVPKFTVMFDDLGGTLPLLTVAIISISNMFARFWWLMLGFSVFAVLGLRRWLSSANGRLKLDQFLLKLPLIGKFIIIVEVTRLTWILGILIESGLVVTRALNSVWMTINNMVIRQQIMDVSADVANGASLQTAFSKCSFFPEMALNMISVGEETGSLEKGLYKVSETYDRQTDQMVKTLVSIIGPLILIVIVSFVGVFVISMILPILQMNLLIQ